MKKISVIKVLLIALVLMLPVVSTVSAQEEAAKPEAAMAEAAKPGAAKPEAAMAEAADTSAVMTINRFVTCQGIENREPAGETATFTAGTETAYAFLEARNISADVEVNVVWIYDGNEVARVPLSIRQGSRWRTNSSKQLAGRPGAWQVQVQDAKSAVLASLDFTAE
ncbi:MAG: DUF2914 domain-containing protein [Thermodesulfobacteriota bacterium]